MLGCNSPIPLGIRKTCSFPALTQAQVLSRDGRHVRISSRILSLDQSETISFEIPLVFTIPFHPVGPLTYIQKVKRLTVEVQYPTSLTSQILIYYYVW